MTRRTAVTVGLLLCLGAAAFASALVGMLMTMIGSPSPDQATGCTAGEATPVAFTGAAPHLNSGQLANAQAVIAEGYRLDIPESGIVTALAVAHQESGFNNYANDGKGADLSTFQKGIQASLELPHDAVGSDHGSLGIFQQQWPWWGSMSDLMTPAKAADKFYKALLAVPSWQSMTPTAAGQAVQHSAYPTAYADDVPLAQSLINAAGPAPDTECAAAVSSPGRVVMPLAPGSHYVDEHNFGDTGGHWAHGHTGDDLAAACGTSVVAATNGSIIIRTDQSWAGKWLVEVSTGSGRLTTWYGHMRALTVQQGEQVVAGQQIGEVGDLGNATGCHLHFEVHPRGGGMYVDDIDPAPWLASNVGHHLGGWMPVSSTSPTFTVSTFNTLGNSHTSASGKDPGRPSGAARTHGVVQLLDQYDVDVVGFQEFQRPQHDAFVRLAGSTYQVFSARGDTDNSIAWKTSRFELMRATTFPVPYFDGHPRQMPIVRLEDRRTGQQLVFVNVHNPADTKPFPHQAAFRAQAVRHEIEVIGQLEQQYGLPVILTGDLNDSHDAFCELGQHLGMQSASGGSTTPCYPPAHAGIDWILGTDGVRFMGYVRDKGLLVQHTSDHGFVAVRASAGSAP